MLRMSDLKFWLHRNLGQQDTLLLILASLDEPSQIRELKNVAAQAGFRVPNTWNPSSILSKSKGLAIRTPTGWEITNAGIQHLKNKGVSKVSAAAIQVSTDLREELVKIKSVETHSYVEEAIKCYESGFYRSAIIMSWVGAVSVLHKHVYQYHLFKFNKEAKRVNPKWKDINNVEEFTNMKESEFLDRISALSIIDGNVKRELKRCLGLRNSCSHPNSLVIRANATANHLEILLLNVFNKFH